MLYKKGSYTEHFTSEKRKINVFAGIGFYGKTDLFCFNGSFTVEIFKQIIESLYRDSNLFKEKKKLQIVWDNSMIHHAKITQEILRKKHLKSLFLPAYSPDLNPIENVWAVMKQDIYKNKFKSVEELIEKLEEVWDSIDPKKFIKNFSQRIETVQEQNGGITRY